MQFEQLPEVARIVAHEIIKCADNKQQLTRFLDLDCDFREAIGNTDPAIYPKEVDAVVRHFNQARASWHVTVKYADSMWSLCVDPSASILKAEFTDRGAYRGPGRITTTFDQLSQTEIDEIKAIAIASVPYSGGAV